MRFAYGANMVMATSKWFSRTKPVFDVCTVGWIKNHNFHARFGCFEAKYYGLTIEFKNNCDEGCKIHMGVGDCGGLIFKHQPNWYAIIYWNINDCTTDLHITTQDDSTWYIKEQRKSDILSYIFTFNIRCDHIIDHILILSGCFSLLFHSSFILKRAENWAS